MVDLYIPMARLLPLAYGTDHPFARIEGSAVFQDDTDEIAHVFGGRSAKPNQPITIVGPDGRTPITILSDGETEAGELADLAQDAVERGRARLAKGGNVMDFAAYRERRGLPAHEDVRVAVAEAIAARIAHHRANPVTDPPRKVLYRERRTFPAAGGRDGL